MEVNVGRLSLVSYCEVVEGALSEIEREDRDGCYLTTCGKLR